MSVSLEYETHTQEKILEFSKLLVRGIGHTNITKEIHRLLSQDSPNMLEAIVVLAFYMRIYKHLYQTYMYAVKSRKYN